MKYFYVTLIFGDQRKIVVNFASFKSIVVWRVGAFCDISCIQKIVTLAFDWVAEKCLFSFFHELCSSMTQSFEEHEIHSSKSAHKIFTT